MFATAPTASSTRSNNSGASPRYDKLAKISFVPNPDRRAEWKSVTFQGLLFGRWLLQRNASASSGFLKDEDVKLVATVKQLGSLELGNLP